MAQTFSDSASEMYSRSENEPPNGSSPRSGVPSESRLEERWLEALDSRRTVLTAVFSNDVKDPLPSDPLARRTISSSSDLDTSGLRGHERQTDG